MQCKGSSRHDKGAIYNKMFGNNILNRCFVLFEAALIVVCWGCCIKNYLVRFLELDLVDLNYLITLYKKSTCFSNASWNLQKSQLRYT